MIMRESPSAVGVDEPGHEEEKVGVDALVQATDGEDEAFVVGVAKELEIEEGATCLLWSEAALKVLGLPKILVRGSFVTRTQVLCC